MPECCPGAEHTAGHQPAAGKSTGALQQSAGDRSSAQTTGMRNIGVLWGFGGREELQAAGAHALAAPPDELVTLLRA